MTSKEIVDAVTSYVRDENAKYAILIDGAWGSGKTFLYENDLCDAISDIEIGKNDRKANVYISLYGVSSIEALSKQLLTKNRKCTVEELQRLQGFPHEFVINQKYSEGVKQVGNSVCPLVAEQIGKALRYQIEGLEEYKVPLIADGQKLSFDKRKGVQARKSKAKKKTKISVSNQMSIFDYVEQEKYQYTDFVKERMMDKYKIIWKFNNGDLAIRITGGTSRKKAASIKLEFVGNVRQNFKSINVGVFSEQWEDKYLKLMWDEVHTAVQELSSYDSLMPLYGHFTEPYPKFTIKLDIKYTSEVIEFQKQAIKEDNLKGVMPYSTISLDSDLVTEKLKFMRDYGFDVRTNNTNRTIPEEYFRICLLYRGQIRRCRIMNELANEANKKEPIVPVCEKYTLTIKEAAAYFNIGIKKMRRLAEENTGRFSVFCGNKFLIIRPKFEKFIDDSSEI